MLFNHQFGNIVIKEFEHQQVSTCIWMQVIRHQIRSHFSFVVDIILANINVLDIGVLLREFRNNTICWNVDIIPMIGLIAIW